MFTSVCQTIYKDYKQTPRA